MKTYDISIPIRPDMPVWPGDPAFQRQFPKVSINVTDYVDEMWEATGRHRRNDVEKRKRYALQGQDFDPEKPREKYEEHFWSIIHHSAELLK